MTTKITISTLAHLETDEDWSDAVVIQRRGVDNGELRENFYRNWADYKQGFGDKKKEFWLGLDQIHQLTQAGDKKLRVELEANDGTIKWAEYDTFRWFLAPTGAQGVLMPSVRPCIWDIIQKNIESKHACEMLEGVM